MNRFQFLPRMVAFVFAVLCIGNAYSQSPRMPVYDVYSGDGRHSVLIGTVHVGIKGMIKPNVVSLLLNAKRLVIEHHDEIPQVPLDSGERSPWAKGLTDAEVDVFVHRASCAGVSRDDALKKLNYATAQHANQLAYTVCGVSGKEPSRDKWILDAWQFLERGKPETLEEDVWVELQRRSVPKDGDIHGLRWILNRDPKSVLQGVVDDMNRGDYDSIAIRWRDSIGDQPAAENYFNVMVNKRNAHWLPRLKDYIDDGAAVILVGAMHLPGKYGLVEMLRSAGYRVERGSVLAFKEK